MNKRDTDKQIRKASLAGHGYVRGSTLGKYHIQSRTLRTLVAEGTAHKVKPGLYKLTSSGATAGAWGDFVDVCTAIPSAVICLYSALSYYDLTTFNPPQVAIALPRNMTPARMSFPPVKAFRFSERFYSPGIEHIREGAGHFGFTHPRRRSVTASGSAGPWVKTLRSRRSKRMFSLTGSILPDSMRWLPSAE